MNPFNLHGIETTPVEYVGDLRRQSKLRVFQHCYGGWPDQTAYDLCWRISGVFVEANDFMKPRVIWRPARLFIFIQHLHNCYRSQRGKLTSEVIITQPIT